MGLQKSLAMPILGVSLGYLSKNKITCPYKLAFSSAVTLNSWRRLTSWNSLKVFNTLRFLLSITKGREHSFLACLCDEPHPNCSTALKFVQELENLCKLCWPNTEIKVLKFGDVE